MLKKQNTKKQSVFESATTDKEKSKRLIAGSIASMLATIVGGLCLAVWMIITTQLLGPKDFGIFGPVHQLFWAAITVMSLGINFAMTTYIAHHWQEDKNSAREFAISGNKLLFLISVYSTVIIILLTLLFFKFKIISFIVAGIIITCVIAIFTNLQFWSIQGILLGVQRTDYYAIGNFIFPLSNSISAIIFIFLAQNVFGKESQIDIISALSGLVFGGIFGYLTAKYFLKKVDIEIYKNLYNFKKKYGLYGNIIKFGGITTIANVSYTLFNSLPCVLVGFIAMRYKVFANTLSENLKISGYFSSSYLFASVAMMIMGLVSPLISAMSEAEAKNKKELMQHYFDLILKYTLAILFGCFIFFAGIGGEVVNALAGKEYPIEKVGPLTIILSFGICFVGLFYLFMNIFIGVKKPKYSAVCLLIGLLLQVLFIIYSSFIYKDINKVSMSFSLSAIATFFFTLFYLLYSIKLKIKLPIILIPIFCGVISYFITNKFVPKENLLFIVYAVVLSIIYATLFIISDRMYLQKITNHTKISEN